jgi:hypothetical protein
MRVDRRSGRKVLEETENSREFGWEKEDGLCKNTVTEKELEL